MYAKGYFIKSPVTVSYGKTVIVCTSGYPADIRDASFVSVQPCIKTSQRCSGDILLHFGAGIEGIDYSGGTYVSVKNTVAGSSRNVVPTVINARSIGYLQLLSIENQAVSGYAEVEYVKWAKEWSD